VAGSGVRSGVASTQHDRQPLGGPFGTMVVEGASKWNLKVLFQIGAQVSAQ